MNDTKPNLKFINRDMMKYIAVIVMFIGHFLVKTIKELNMLGIPWDIANVLIQFQYMAPPIFFFFIAEGFYYTGSRKRYAIRLFGFALITQVAYVLCETLTFDVRMFFTSWNVMMTLFLGLMVLIIWECELPLLVRLLLIIGCGLVNYLLKMEWAITGLLIIFAFYIFRKRPIIRMVVYELIMVGHIAVGMGGIGAVFGMLPFFVTTFLAIILITFFYNGKKGKHPRFAKYFFYIFYPAHLFLIFIIRVVAG